MATEPIIKVDDIYKTYDLGEISVTALNGVSLTIQDGEFFIITGRNGSGKSTLLHQLGLLDRPDSGSIVFSGRDVLMMSEKERAGMRVRELGYIFQEYALMAELTALENVMLPAMMVASRQEARARALDLLDRVGVAHRVNNLPRQCSGGEQQKIAIARALINNPAVIFADEPTANLDSIAAEGIMELFQSLNTEEHHTLVMITHEQDETHYATQLINLVDGKVA
ncbi:MAG: ABC transporter ATP-binding protein [Actinomycetota bacterium]